ncbi:unnamed protein product [Effrenium voratum]|nr:unnamed protein product [Effrenium voratum]
MRLEQTSIAQFTSMACVRLLDGTDVMTTEEYSVWRDELRGNEDEDCFFDALRRNLAKRLRLQNFRRLALACGIGNLGPESPWGNSECLTAVVRQYVEAEGLASGVDLLRAAERGDLRHVLELLETPHDPNAIDTNRQRVPLHNAAANGHQAVVQCLLDAGADTEKADNDGFTPLHLAAQAITQLCNACWTPALTKRRRRTMASHHCILLHFRAIRKSRNACWTPALTKRRRQTMT